LKDQYTEVLRTRELRVFIRIDFGCIRVYAGGLYIASPEYGVLLLRSKHHGQNNVSFQRLIPLPRADHYLVFRKRVIDKEKEEVHRRGTKRTGDTQVLPRHGARSQTLSFDQEKLIEPPNGVQTE
jgi:hypothetical protein